MSDTKHIYGAIKEFGYKEFQGRDNFYLVLETDGRELPTKYGKGLEEAFKAAGDLQVGDSVNLKDFGIDETTKKRVWEIELHESYHHLTNAIEPDTEHERQKPLDQTAQDEPLQAKPTLHKTPTIDDLELALPSNIKNNYIAITKNRFMSDEKINYYDIDDKDQVNIAFEDRKNSLNTSRQDEKTIHAMLDLAESKGWSAIKLKGTEEFKQKTWLEASLRGIETSGYTPSEKDKAELIAKQTARTTNQAEMTAQKPPQDKEYSEHNNENHQKQSSINDAFNQQLQDLIDGKLNEKHIFQLGKPSDILLNTGFPNTPIELKASKLWEKSQTDWHKFDIASAKDLPRALQEPMAVFAYGDKHQSQNVITEIEHDGKKFVVGVHFNQTQDGIEINSVRGFFPKDNPEWLNWIAQDKALYLDKEKVQTLIAQQRTNLADVSYLDLNLITSVVKNFDNVKQNNDKSPIPEIVADDLNSPPNPNTEPLQSKMQQTATRPAEPLKRAEDIKKDIRQIFQNGYKDGSIKSRDDLVAVLKERGFDIKENDKSISVSLPNGDKAVNLKGEVFTKGYDAIKSLQERLDPDNIKKAHPNISDVAIAQITAWKEHVLDKYKTPQARQEVLVRLDNSVKDVANGKDLGMPPIPPNQITPDIEVRGVETSDKSRSR